MTKECAASESRSTSCRALPAGGTATNIGLKRLIAVGYSVTDLQIFGDLPWLEPQRFDAEAKASALTALPQLRLMMQSLLDEKFKLKFHRETKELPVYTLTTVKNGVKGQGLIEAPNQPGGTADAPQAPSSGSQSPQAPCGAVNPMPGRIFGQRGRMSQLADRLSTLLGCTVVDKTSLNGSYNIELTFTPEMELLQQPPAGMPAADGGPSIFTASQEQLGLRLQAGKGPVEVIVGVLARFGKSLRFVCVRVIPFALGAQSRRAILVGIESRERRARAPRTSTGFDNHPAPKTVGDSTYWRFDNLDGAISDIPLMKSTLADLAVASRCGWFRSRWTTCRASRPASPRACRCSRPIISGSAHPGARRRGFRLACVRLRR